MRKILIIIILLLFVVLLYGCSQEGDLGNSAEFTNKEHMMTVAESHAKKAESELPDASNNVSNYSVRNIQNTVVETPKKNKVTYEIDKKLVGKYAVEDDQEMYFEIKPDGKVEISLNALEGYAKYSDSANIELTAFYTDTIVIINFNLIDGQHTFPANCGLSISFEGDVNFASFLSTVYWADDRLEFVKQNIVEANYNKSLHVDGTSW
jgi:hypothetical protein